MVSSIRGASRAIVALCSLIVAHHSDLASATTTNSDLLKCLEKAGIQTSTPSTVTWSVDTQAWNSRINPKPSCVAYPKSEKEVTAALQCAAAASVKVTTLGGNRSFSSMGFGRNDNALVMNMKNMRYLFYEEATKCLSFGGDITIAQATLYLWEKSKRTFPHGRCPDVGIMGVSLAGFGTMSRACGTVLDNIVSVRIALANGTIVNADAKENSDIFWMARGAANSLGVVIKFKINTFEVPSQRVTNYTIGFKDGFKPTQHDNVNALIGVQTWALSKDNNDYVALRFFVKTVSEIKGLFYGSGEEATKVLESLMKYLPTSMVLTTEEHNFWDSEEIGTPGLFKQLLTPRRCFYIVSMTISSKTPLTNATAWQLFTHTAFVPKDPKASTSGFVDLWGGKYTKTVKPDASAWKHDDNLLLVRHDMRTSAADVQFPESSMTTMRTNFYKFVSAYKASGGVPGGFTTYRDDQWTQAEMAEYLYGGGNYKKLQQIKTEYDPGEMFNPDMQSIHALKP